MKLKKQCEGNVENNYRSEFGGSDNVFAFAQSSVWVCSAGFKLILVVLFEGSRSIDIEDLLYEI